jgi:hypothetical protein
MSKWNRKQLVLDASLSTCSSDRMFNPIGDEAGERNRKCLQAVWEEEHFAVFNDQLRREWRDHASPFSLAWLQNMTQKSRVLFEEGLEFSVLLERVCAAQRSDARRAEVRKDFHLIQSALATGQLLISNEVRLPHHVAVACDSNQELLLLYYCNPAVEGERCRLWIKAGAEKDPTRRIDKWMTHYAAEHG